MPEPRGAYLTDSWTRRDLLGFSDFRPALVKILKTAQTPLTVGVFGPWGSGKTSLLRMVQQDLDEAPGEWIRTVWFTAWKYDRHEALWRAFILRVLGALHPDEGQEGGAELTQKLQRLEESVYRPVEWKELGKLTADWSRLLPEAGKAAGALAAALIPGGEVVRGILAKLAGGKKDDPDLPEAAAAIRREVHRHHRAQLSHMEQFEATFAEALRDSFQGEPGRLVVFVDDLDRCLPEKAVEVLEAIKLFLEVEGTEFVLAMDAEVIERGIETRYGELFRRRGEERGELPISGSAYLQKIVQIPFHLPALGVDDLEGYIGSLLSPSEDARAGASEPVQRAQESAEAAEHEDEQAVDEVTRKVFAQGVFPNPRQVKRALNIFRLLREIALERERSGSLEPEVVAWPLLAKTVLIQTQAPELYRQWRQYPTLIATLEKEYRRRPARGEEIELGRTARLKERSREREEESGKEQRPEQGRDEERTGGLLADYLTDRRRYAWLERMLGYPAPEDAAKVEGRRRRSRFEQLASLDEQAAYTRLAGAVAAEKPEAAAAAAEAPADLLAEMLSGDAVKIDDAVARLEDELKKLDEAEASRRRGAVQQALQAVMEDASRPARERAGAGDALAAVGDHRFDPERWFLPRDPLVGFRLIPEGRFLMGSRPDDPSAADWEKNQHELTLPSFYLARFPVTAAQFLAYAEAAGETDMLSRLGKQRVNHPVVEVAWNEALAYCRWLNVQLEKFAKARLSVMPRRGEPGHVDIPKGSPWELWQALSEGTLGAGLPSEAEWEKAARGTEGRIYPWGDHFDPEKANTTETGVGRTSAVGCFPAGASHFGCEEMSGSVWEWTRSLWGTDPAKPKFTYPYKPDRKRENLEAPPEALRVLRGGSFILDHGSARCAVRLWSPPQLRFRYLGFRVVLSPFFSDL